MRKIENQKGYSYLEVILALIIIGIVLVPISEGIISSINTSQYNKSIYRASISATTLLEKIKEQLDYKSSSNSDLSPFSQDEANNNTQNLDNFIAWDQKEEDYEYEAIIWRVDQKEEFILNKNGMQQNNIVLKLSTIKDKQNRPVLTPLEDNVLTKFNLNIKDKMNYSKERARVEIGALDNVFEKGIPILKLGTDANQDQLEEYETLKSSFTAMKLSYSKMGEERTYGIETLSTIPEKKGEIYIDATDSALINSSNQRTIRLKNKSPKNLVIKLLDPRNKVNLLVQQFSGEENASPQKGSVIVKKISEIEPKRNYVIAILVREKNGEILAQTMDLYSFQP